MTASDCRFKFSRLFQLAGLGGMGTNYRQLLGTSEARVTGDGTTLYLPAHGVMVVR